MAYRVLRLLFGLALRVFYGRIEIQGADRLPAGPLLLVANHSNAFVDPLWVITALRRRVTVTAKRSLLSSPPLAWLMRCLGGISFRRQQDTATDRAEAASTTNRAALTDCARCLAAGGAVLIFPEGRSHSGSELLPFKTGFARLALPADISSKDSGAEVGEDGVPEIRGLNLVPVGLCYAAKGRLRSTVQVRFGKPTAIEAWQHSQTERQLPAVGRAAVRQLSREMRRQVEELIAHPLSGSTKSTAAATPTGLARWLALEPLWVGLPMAAWAALHHALPWWVVGRCVRRYARDDDHLATYAIFLGLPVFLATYLLLAATALIVLPLPWAFAYVVSVAVAGPVALHFRDRIRLSRSGL